MQNLLESPLSEEMDRDSNKLGKKKQINVTKLVFRAIGCVNKNFRNFSLKDFKENEACLIT